MKNINLIYVPMEKLKTTTIGVYIHRELNRNDVSKNAMVPYVLKRGCKLCPDSEAMAKYLENLYGATLGAGVMTFGNDQVMRFEGETISDKYAAYGEPLTRDLLKLILSVIFEPVVENGGFLKAVIDTEKNNAKDRILSAMNDKRTYAMQRCTEEMCKGEAYAMSKNGTVEGIEAIDEKALYEYYKNAVTSSVIDIYVCGTADMNGLNKLVDEMTAEVHFSDAAIINTELHKNGGDVKRVTDRMDVNQGKLSIGFTTDTAPKDQDYFALMVMNSIFGSGAHSKLFNNVREKLSLAYYASSNLVSSKGIMLVNAGIEFKNFDEAYNETLAQLSAIQNGEISELEFNSSVSAILNSYESFKDDPRLLHTFMAGEKNNKTNYTLDFVKDRISKVTVDEVIAVSKKIKLDTVYFLTGKEER